MHETPLSTTARAQAHTIEGVLAALVLVSTLVWVIGATPQAAVSTDASTTRVESQHRTMAADLLASSASTGDLREAVLYWDPTNRRFADAPAGSTHYRDGGPPTAFGNALDRAFGSRGLVFNVYVLVRADTGSITRQPMVVMGTPGDDAVRVRRVVSIPPDAALTAPSARDRTVRGVRNDPTARLFVPRPASGSDIVHTEVELVVWQG